MVFEDGFRENFVKNINLFLKEKNWSRNRFARELGTDSSHVSKWLNGLQEPGLTFIYRILRVLDCTFEELVN